MTFLPKLRRLTAALLISGMAFASPAQAQLEISPEHLAKAREYVDLTDSAQLYERALVEMGLRVMRLMIQEDPSLRDPLINALQTVYDNYLLNRDPLYNQFARIYAVRFSVEELDEILAFYNTPVGQKLLGQNATINEDLQLALQVWTRNMSTEFLSRVRTELRNQGYNAPQVQDDAAAPAEEAPAQ